MNGGDIIFMVSRRDERRAAIEDRKKLFENMKNETYKPPPTYRKSDKTEIKKEKKK